MMSAEGLKPRWLLGRRRTLDLMTSLKNGTKQSIFAKHGWISDRRLSVEKKGVQTTFNQIMTDDGHSVKVVDHQVGLKDECIQQPEVDEFKSSYGTYKHGAVASDSKICSEIGKLMMEVHGGNAIDAAVATALCSSVVYPHSTGPGGGMMAVLYHGDHGVLAVDGREKAPMKASPKMFTLSSDRKQAEQGAKSVCVPGFVMGLVEMHKQFGLLPWKTLVRPTIDLLKAGVPLTAQTYLALVRYIAPNVGDMKGFQNYLDNQNHFKLEGSPVFSPTLLQTFETLAEDPLSFYHGQMADNIVKDLQDEGGIIEKSDLEGYKVRIKKPLKTTLPGDMTLYTAPAPSCGPVLAYILNILSGYNMGPADIATEEGRVQAYHRMIEAVKFAMAKKTCLGDDDFVDVEEAINQMTSQIYAQKTRMMIDEDRTHDLSYYGPCNYNQYHHGTSHTSVVDKDGNCVTISSSINLYFGSRIVGNRTGIVYNNTMCEFSLPYLKHFTDLDVCPGNVLQPGKRPQSCMCPAIIWDDHGHKVRLVTGASGCLRIPAAVAQTISDVLWFGMSVPRSLDRPRLYHNLIPMNIEAEPLFPYKTKRALEKKQHRFLEPDGITVVQMIQISPDGDIVAGSDFRKGGQPSGY